MEIKLDNGEKRVIRKLIGIKQTPEMDEFERMCEQKKEEDSKNKKKRKNSDIESDLEGDD